jgi:hypothetical protein
MAVTVNKKYVVLEHLNLPNKGFRFWSTNSDNNTHSANGELWYKEIAFTDDTEEAIKLSRDTGTIPTMGELEKYYRERYEETTLGI